MAATVIYNDRPFETATAEPAGDELWLSADDLTAATGWESKPQGMCLGELCVPIAPARRVALFDANERINLAAFARDRGQPVVHDDATHTWLFGASAEARRDTLRSLEAPGFSLPDLDGKLHALSDYRGKKILLLSWASW